MPATVRFAASTAVTFAFLITPAFAQPYAWTITNGVFTGTQLIVINLATTERVSAVSVPRSIAVAGATVTADGADYLISTSLGIVRFRTQTRTMEGVFGPPVAGRLGAAGNELHLVSSGTYYVLDATTGEILAQRSVAAVFQVLFSPDQSIRYEIEAAQGATETTVRATSVQSSLLLWQQAVPGLHGRRAAAGANDIAFDVTVGGVSKLVVLAASTGSERARLDLAVQGLACCRDNSLFVSTTGPMGGTGTVTFRLLSIDLSTLTQSVVLEVPGLVAFGAPLDVVLSSDRSVAYWLTFAGIKLSFASTTDRTVDLATGEVLSTGSVGGQVYEIAVQPGIPCRFNLTTAASIGAEGGTLDIPVTPSASCDPWLAQSLNYGVAVVKDRIRAQRLCASPCSRRVIWCPHQSTSTFWATRSTSRKPAHHPPLRR